ncbi:MAG: NFACT family protein [Candidatus Diapherotrites archaeon]|nr:NFACT family protein [Candidatus Diapherotrites archaeon]
MQADSLVIAQLVEELKPLIEESHINKIQELEGNSLKIRLHSKEGSLDLIISPEAIWVSQFKLSTLSNPKGFAGFLKKYLSNKKIMKVWQKDLDRVIVLEMEKFFLACEFFDEGNIVLCDKEWKILQPFRRGEWKDRKLAKGETYKFPQNINEQKRQELEKKRTGWKKIEGLMEQLDEEFSKKISQTPEAVEKESQSEKKRAKLLHSIKEQEKAKEKFQNEILENQKKAELIYANAQEIEELLNAIKKGKAKELPEKEIEAKIIDAGKKGNLGARLVKEISLKEKKIVLRL